MPNSAWRNTHKPRPLPQFTTGVARPRSTSTAHKYPSPTPPPAFAGSIVIGRHVPLYLATDIKEKRLGWRGIRVAVGNAEGATFTHWRLPTGHPPLNELLHGLVQLCRRALVFQCGDAHLGKVDDTNVQGNALGEMRNAENRMPGLPVRLLPERAGGRAKSLRKA